PIFAANILPSTGMAARWPKYSQPVFDSSGASGGVLLFDVVIGRGGAGTVPGTDRQYRRHPPGRQRDAKARQSDRICTDPRRSGRKNSSLSLSVDLLLPDANLQSPSL